jgi:hypothetical protein
MKQRLILQLLCLIISANLFAQNADSFRPDFSPPAVKAGMTLVWNDEFNIDGKPDNTNWKSAREYAEYTSSSIQTRGLRQWRQRRGSVRKQIPYHLRGRLDQGLSVYELKILNTWIIEHCQKSNQQKR